MLRALAGPFAHTGVKFVPLGGVGPGNLAEYLVLPGVAAVGGSWMIERSLIRAGRFGEIERLLRQAVAVARRPGCSRAAFWHDRCFGSPRSRPFT